MMTDDEIKRHAERDGWLVKLTYFKPSGKMYSGGEFTSHKPWLFEIFAEVRQMFDERKLPDLIEGHSRFSVLIDVPDHPHRHPHMIFGEVEL